MEKKQTAVEWMVDILERYIQNLSQDDLENLSNLFDQAKKMEKEQIMDAWDVGLCTGSMHDICSEYYYNDTFGGKDE